MHPNRHTYVWTVAVSVAAALVGGCPPQNSNTNDNAGGTGNDGGGNPATDSVPAVSRMSPFDDAAAGTVKLRWNPIGNVDYYTVFAGTESDPPRVLSVTESQFSLDTIACVTYYWRIEAHEGSKVSSSPVWSFRTVCPTDRPAVPAYPAPSHEAYDVRPAATSDGPTLQWAATKNTERYDVYLGRTTSPEYAGSTGTAAFKAPVLADGRQYYWRVVAHNSAGDTSSPLWAFMTTEVAAGPRAPAMYFPANKRTAMPTRLRFDWSDVAEAHSFEFYFGTDKNPPLLATVTESEYTPAGDFELGETYYWRVVAVNAGGRNSTPTRSFATADTPQPPLMAMSPTPEAGATDVNTDMELSWTPIANADTYDVYVGVLGGDMPLVATVVKPPYVPPTPLLDGRIYDWKVVAHNGVGSTAGPRWRFSTNRVPSVAEDDEPGLGGGSAGPFASLGSAPCDGTLSRINRTVDGGQTIRGARLPVISGDGRYVAYVSPSEDIVPGDTNGVRDAFVCDRVTGETRRVSVTTSGAQRYAPVGRVDISRDGRFVVFTDMDGGASVHDCQTHTTRDFASQPYIVPADPAISADGRYIAIEHLGQVHVYDVQTGGNEIVSRNDAGVEADDFAGEPEISDDGRYVVFYSNASNLGGQGFVGGNNQTRQPDVYVRDRSGGTTIWVGVFGRIGIYPSISGDGRWVAFTAVPTGVLSNPLDALDYQLFVREIGGGDARMASVDPNGSPSDGVNPWQASWSYDARYLTFTNFGRNLVSGSSGNLNAHIFHLDTSSGEMLLLDQGIGGEANDNAIQSCVTADGRTVVFDSRASNLVPDDTNGKREVFIICLP